MNRITEVVDKYVNGALYRKPELLREIFMENAVMNGIDGGRISTVPAAKFIERIENDPPMCENMPEGITFTATILNISVFDQIANVTFRENKFAGKVDFYTSFQLMKQPDGSWKIAAKMFEKL